MKHTSTFSRRVQFAGHTIKFDIETAELLSLVEAHFAHCLGGDENIVAEYQVRAEVEASPDGQAQFSISKDGVELAAHIDLEGVLFQLMQDGLTQLNGASKTELIFHAVALIWQMCDGNNSVDDIVNILGGAYPDARAQIAKEVP